MAQDNTIIYTVRYGCLWQIPVRLTEKRAYTTDNEGTKVLGPAEYSGIDGFRLYRMFSRKDIHLTPGQAFMAREKELHAKAESLKRKLEVIQAEQARNNDLYDEWVNNA